MQKMTITHDVFKRIEVETEVELPIEPLYCFQTGVRRTIRFIPRFVTWDDPTSNKGDVYEYSITCVYNQTRYSCLKVEKLKIPVYKIGEFVNSKSDGDINDLCRMLVNKSYELRSKERFQEDLENAIEYLKSVEDN